MMMPIPSTKSANKVSQNNIWSTICIVSPPLVWETTHFASRVKLSVLQEKCLAYYKMSFLLSAPQRIIVR